jgi:membrane-associated phospholipid phosphatase
MSGESVNGSRFYWCIGVFLAVTFAIEVALCQPLRLVGIVKDWPIVFACGVCFLCATPFPRLREFSLLVLLGFASSDVLGAIPVLAARATASVPLADHRLSSLDEAANLHVAALVHWVRQHPGLDALSHGFYAPVALLLIVAAVLIPPLIGHAERARHYIAAVAIGVMMTTLLFMFVPAIGPWTVEDFAPNVLQSKLTDYILQLRSSEPMTMKYGGVISFPSFHCTFAVLTANALSCIRWLRWPLWITSALICISTVTTGWHYGVDVLGGIAVAFAAIVAAHHVEAGVKHPAFAPGPRPPGTSWPKAAPGSQCPQDGVALH